MALLVDGPPNTINDLSEEDHTALTVASVEKIDMAMKCKRTHQDILSDLQGRLRRAGYRRGQLGLSMVEAVVADDTIRQLHLYRTLESLYRDAFMGSASDAYKERMHEYAEMARKAERRLHLEGVRLCSSPLPRPEEPRVRSEPGVGPTGNFVVRTTLVNSQHEESAPSCEQLIENPTGRAIVVTPPNAHRHASSWRVYIGEIGKPAFAQTENSLPFFEEWRTQLSSLIANVTVGNGQEGTFTIRIIPFLNRG